MKIKNILIDKLAGNYDTILVFDCEFWHVYGSEGYIPIQKAPNEFFMPREIGGFLLKRSGNSWTYKTHFFVTLAPPKGKDVSFISSAFATVNSRTADILDSYQGLLSVPWASAYLNTLPSELHDLLIDGINTYLSDPNIKQAHKPASWYKTFLKEFENALVVVKGPTDLEAIHNACKFYNIPFVKPKSVYDIAEWNAQSRKRCKTAKLEGTYECIVDKLDYETKKLTKILPLGKAHDPSSDAAMTFIVALYITYIRSK